MTGTTKPLVGVSHVRSDLCDPVRPVGAVKSVRCRSLHIQKEMETLTKEVGQRVVVSVTFSGKAEQ
jgi:hypothetical protein